jgi:hypothetical protein
MNSLFYAIGSSLGPEGSTLVGIIMAAMLVFAVIGVALWVYMGLVYSAIARKARHSSPNLAWIPIVGPSIVTSSIAKMHWWPILLLIGGFIPVIGTLCSLAFLVFFVIWNWKTFEVIGRPGWWAIFMVIPILNIVFLVLLGVAAWSSSK